LGVGGIALANITVGNGGTVVINAAALLGNSTDAARAGAITQVAAGTRIDTGTGTVTLIARDNGIGRDIPLEIVASTIAATTNSVASSKAAGQTDASININASGNASFAATTTTAGTNIGTISLSSSGVLRLHGDVKTDDGSITLTAPDTIQQTAGKISTTGTLTLSSSSSAQLGGTGNSIGTLVLVPGQDLIVDGDLTTASPINFDGGDVLEGILGGHGKINTSVNITNKGNLAPGNSPGILGSGSVTWSGGSRFSVEVSGPIAGTGYDQLQVTGTVDLGNAIFSASDPTLTYAPAGGAKHFIILNDGADAITNTFNGLAEGATVTINGINYTISYVGNGDGGGVGNDVVLIAPGVPTPPPTATPLVNGAGIQRSMVQSIVVGFSESVNFPDGLAAAFNLNRYKNGSAGTIGLTFNPASGPASSVTITFNNTGTISLDPASSVPDGTYQLNIVAEKISGTGGTLDGNKNGIAQGSPTDDIGFQFHRLFGDSNGSGNVDGTDFVDFRGVFGLPLSGAPQFNYFGAGAGNVGGNEFSEFRKRFGLNGYLP
jgi:hypothetical protein